MFKQCQSSIFPIIWWYFVPSAAGVYVTYGGTLYRRWTIWCPRPVHCTENGSTGALGRYNVPKRRPYARTMYQHVTCHGTFCYTLKFLQNFKYFPISNFKKSGVDWSYGIRLIWRHMIRSFRLRVTVILGGVAWGEITNISGTMLDRAKPRSVSETRWNAKCDDWEQTKHAEHYSGVKCSQISARSRR